MALIESLEYVVTQCGMRAAAVRRQGQRFLAPQDKQEQRGQHFSTRADRESKELGMDLLHSYFPAETIVHEEDEEGKKPKEIPADCTVFDPWDGTTNLFNGIKEGGVTACILRNHFPIFGAAYFPYADLLVSAMRGKGCWIGGYGRGELIEKIQWHGKLDKAQIGTDIGSWCHTHNTFDTILKPLSMRFNILSAMSAIEGMRRVLFGETVVYYNLGIAKIWDAAAMALAVEEAGGFVCGPDGLFMPWDRLDCDWVAAINPDLAKLVLEHSRHWTGRVRGS